MEFRNHTPFPALAFEGIDPDGQRFHVIALRQTLTFASGQLEYADEQAPLCEVDAFFGDMNQSSVRQESDLCQYKPRCDVIVNATAHAPGGKPARQFDVRLCVTQPDIARPPPEPPRPLNPFMPVSEADLRQWRHEVEQARATPLPGAVLIDKTLTVTGPRQFTKKRWPTRLIQWVLKWGTLTLIRPNPWKLTRARKLATLPLRYEYAYGGQNRIDASDKRAARRVPKKHRLTAEERAGHPDRDVPAAAQPAAHTVCEANLHGKGFAQAWWIGAAKPKAIPAPQIAAPGHPLTAKLFWQSLRGKRKPTKPGQATPFEPAGLGIRAKVHPERRALLGTVDDAFIQGDAWLPGDFDFAIWNAAPVDQQTPYLQGDEIIELTNLCTPHTPGATVNAKGNTVLRLPLPQHECFTLLRLESGEMHTHPLSIDTVMIEPDDQSLTLVWRTTLIKDDAAPIRVCEARMHTLEDKKRLHAEIDRIRQMARPEKQATPSPDEDVLAEVAR